MNRTALVLFMIPVANESGGGVSIYVIGTSTSRSSLDVTSANFVSNSAGGGECSRRVVV